MGKIGKPSIKNFGKPRPTALKAIGDTCVYAGGVIAGISTANNNEIITYISIAFMIAGNLFTNLWAANSDEYENDNSESDK